MFEHKHYVPILKTKAGERWAVDHTEGSRKQHITPLFEIHRHAQKDTMMHAADICDDLASIWGTDDVMFLDTCWLHTSTGDPAIIEAVFEAARNSGVRAVPVATIDYDSASLDVIADIVAQDGLGFLLRLDPERATAHARISQAVSHVGVAHADIDLLLDYKNVPMHLPLHVPQLPHLASWRTFTSSSAAFPRSLAGLAIGTWHQVQRNDWNSWHMGIAQGLPRLPSFGDYTTRDSGPAAEFGAPRVNLRYTKDSYWLVRVARKLREGYAADMHTVCAELISRTEYDGSAFSDGDEQIYLAANMQIGSGSVQQWLQWGMNHHIAFTVEQLAGLP